MWGIAMENAIGEFLQELGLTGAWHSFIAVFCRLNFLCHEGEPSGPGWIVIALGAFVLVVMAFSIRDRFSK